MCPKRTLKERLRLHISHTWATRDDGMYGTKYRRCSWCGAEQYKHRMFRRWITVE